MKPMAESTKVRNREYQWFHKNGGFTAKFILKKKTNFYVFLLNWILHAKFLFKVFGIILK